MYSYITLLYIPGTYMYVFNVIRQNRLSLVNNQRGEHSATKPMDREEVSADWLRLRLDQTKLT